MADPRIGRILVAGLHQAIEEELPARTDFYEHWLAGNGLRGKTIGMAPMLAVLSFLRAEGQPYDRVVDRAGRLVAQWYVDRVPTWRRTVARRLPVAIRARLALRGVNRLIRETYSGSSSRSRLARGRGSVAVTASLFCDVRTPSTSPLCRFYAGVARGLLDAYGVSSVAVIEQCRGVGDARCSVALELGRRHASDDEGSASE
jgi:bacteriochlorophyll 4-vinyl reductase